MKTHKRSWTAVVTWKARAGGTFESWSTEALVLVSLNSGRRVTRTQFIYEQNKAARGTGLGVPAT